MTTRKNRLVLAASTLAVLCLTAPTHAQIMKGIMGPGVMQAVAVLQPTEGNKVQGTVTFTKTEKGVRVQADISGLPPDKHGFHIHQYGNTSSTDGMAADEHFNPHKLQHGRPVDEKRHVGDLGNLEADSSGHATFDLIDPALGFSGATSILGRGIVVHEKADDFGQPSGNAGGRLAVGTIGVAKEG